MKNRRIDLPKVLNWILENVIFAVCAAVLFFRTAEVMATFAPKTVMGYENAGPAYGYLCAILVEGVLVLAKFSIAGNRDDLAWMYNVLLIGVTFFISAAAQLVDVQYAREQLASQPPFVQALVNVGIPLVPSIVLLMALGKTVVETIPESIVAQFKGKPPKGRVAVEPRSVPALPGEPLKQLAAEVSAARLTGPTDDEWKQIAEMSYAKIRAVYGGTWKNAADMKKRARLHVAGLK